MNDRDLVRRIADIIGKEATEDDCAVFPVNGEYLVASTDMLHESTDFPQGMSDWQIGWMSVAVTLSDIASMGATPQFLLLAVGLDSVDRFTLLMKGASDCCTSFGGHIAGGDTDFHQELTIVSTGVGSVKKDRIVRRRGSRLGDVICVTGVLGRAQAALEGFRQYEKALYEPQPRVREGQLIASAGATSMTDISDSLSLSLYDLLAVNNVGYAIDSTKLPIPKDIAQSERGDLALYGGGDYELLFTIPPQKVRGITCDYSIIGSVIEDHAVFLDGSILPKRGFVHQWDDTL